MKRRWIALLLALCCLLPLCSACAERDEGKVQILCTVFPLYDWVKNIVGDSETVEVSLLITNGADLHSYQPSAEDMMRIASADLFFYVGGISDAWIEEALQAQRSEKRIDVKMTEIPDVRLREICDDSTVEHDHSHAHGVTDEHLWLSLWNAKVACGYLTEQICALDADKAERYRENFEQYRASIESLDAEYTRSVAEFSSPMLLCSDRFPYVYLDEDYGISYIAAFEP